MRESGVSAALGEPQQALAGGFAKGHGKGRCVELVSKFGGWKPRPISPVSASRPTTLVLTSQAHPARMPVDKGLCRILRTDRRRV